MGGLVRGAMIGVVEGGEGSAYIAKTRRGAVA